ncbi:hypothetical protein [Cytophaga sp. FL35]|uniref:hypothetical protein n=1 Tax=Cytophaga sp. FL35 TaxID=1904456 RepID=UPI0016536B3A|nr:hypothetical protein [Cytophaga sp. FL35]MBC6997575.1 hypothetical protein [Cytophaga sp. FL35]
MKSLFAILFVFVISSCIPVRVAPSIKDYKVTKGKRFKKGLSKRNFFVFEDPKKANEFYDYVNTKFQLKGFNVQDDVPFIIGQDQYYFAFYEVSIPNKTLNLAPTIFNVAVSRALALEDNEEFVPAEEIIRKDRWYIAKEVYSDMQTDCLMKDSFSKESVLAYLRALKDEYLTTHNYNETLFRD